MAEDREGLFPPFVINTAHGSARALGTRYSVRIIGDATIVTVIASRVEACSNRGEQICLLLGPGQVAKIDAAGITRLRDVDPFSADAWSHGVLVADDTPLSEVLNALNEYRVKPVQFDERDIAALRVTGTFPLRDGDRALVSIAAALPVTVSRRGEGVTLQRR